MYSLLPNTIKIDCTESAMHMYKDAIDEFYRCFMEKINQVLSTDGKDINVSIKLKIINKQNTNQTLSCVISEKH